MAIWDDTVNENKKNTKGIADTHKCPGCGFNLVINGKTGQLECKSCGGKYYPEFFEISELLNKVNDEEETDFDDSDKMQKQEIVCNACGATVVTDHNTASTFCAFCGSPALVTNRLSKAFKPDYIIPFKLSKKDAEAKLKEWASTKKFLPKDFLSEKNLKKITGLYVPFWMIDADCHIDIDAGGSVETNNEITFYSVKRSGTFRMKRVPFDGSKHINDRLMESIEPFDYSELVPYSSGYLPGYYAERYDLSVKDMAKRISDRFRDYMFETRDAYMNVHQYTSYSVDYDHSSSDNYECKYALLPVWFINYEYEGLYYRIAINGQTGEIAGRAPVDERKKKLKRASIYAWGYGKYFLLLAFILVLFNAAIKVIVSDYDTFITILCLSPGLMLLLGFIMSLPSVQNKVSGQFKGLLKKVEEDAFSIDEKPYKMPPAITYLDGSYRTEIEKEDKLIHSSPKFNVVEDKRNVGLF